MKKTVSIIAFILVFGGLAISCSRQEPLAAENNQQVIPEAEWQHTGNYLDYHDILESRRLIEEEKMRKYRE